MMSANSRIRFGLRIIFVCLYITPSHHHHRANFIWRHRTYKMPVRYNLSSVWVRLSIFSQLSVIHYTICGAVCFQFTHFLCDDWENIYTLSYYLIKSEVWTITHCLGLGHETMVCGVCLSIFLWSAYDLKQVLLNYCFIDFYNHKLNSYWQMFKQQLHNKRPDCGRKYAMAVGVKQFASLGST